MFCHQCGVEIPGESRFCSSCGTDQPGAARRPSASAVAGASREPVLVLKPVFVPFLQLVGHIPVFLFLGVWGAFFFGGFSMVFLQFGDFGIPKWAPFVFFGVVFACVLPVISFRVNRKTYAKTVYTFFADKLDYFEGFFTVEEKSFALSSVTEVHLRKGPYQSKYGLGTIVLSTPATSVAGGRAGAGIRIRDVENPDEVYRRVKELVERAHPGKRAAA